MRGVCSQGRIGHNGPNRRKARTAGLLQSVEKSVRAAKINDPIHDKRRRINSADANLLIGRHERRFTPVGMIKKENIELSIRQ